jgi:hypothetical protein
MADAGKHNRRNLQMKKILSAVLAALVLVPTLAFAGVIRVERQIPWASYPLNVQTVLGNKPLASAAVDTTAIFSMADAAFSGNGFPVGAGSLYPSGNDSLTVGYIVVYRDTTAAGTTNLTGLTFTIESSHDAVTWASASGFGATCTSGDPTVTIPLTIRHGEPAHWNLLATKLRGRFTTVNGQLPAAKVKLVYWADDGRR